MPSYTFKWKDESIWVIVTAILTYGMVLLSSDLENITDWRKFALSAGVGLLRAIFGALLAGGTGGFRPQTPVGPQTPTIDEKIGVSPRAVARPELPDKADPPTHPGG